MAENTDLEALARTAAKLSRRAPGARGRRVKPCELWFLTDPARISDPAAIVRQLPAGVVVVYRAFGAKDAVEVAQELRRLTRARKQILLIGADAGLAARVGADGVHLPERLMQRAPALHRAHPRWLISAAVHGGQGIERGGRLGLDALLVSAVFPSRSASAKTAMGPIRLASLVRAAHVPVIALGGINNKNAPRLLGTGAAGLAAIDGLALET